jgi:hypothetical protein
MKNNATQVTAALTLAALAFTGCGGGGGGSSSSAKVGNGSGSASGGTKAGNGGSIVGGGSNSGGIGSVPTTGSGSTGSGTTNSGGTVPGGSGTGTHTGGTAGGSSAQALLQMLLQLLGGSGGSGSGSAQAIIQQLLQMVSGGGAGGSGAQALLQQLLQMVMGGAGGANGNTAQSIISMLMQMLGGTSSGGTPSGSGAGTGTGTSTGSGGTSTGSGGSTQGVPTVSYPYAQDFSGQLTGVYAQGAYTAQNLGWGLAQATTQQGQTVNLAAMGGQNGYPSDCSTGNNAQNPEVVMFGAFDFSQVSPNDQPVAAFQVYYNTQGTDGGVFFVYDLTTQQMDTPDPVAGTYDVPLQGGSGGVLAGTNQQVMAFDLSTYAGSSDPYLIGILFESSGQTGQATPGYLAFTDVAVGPAAQVLGGSPASTGTGSGGTGTSSGGTSTTPPATQPQVSFANDIEGGIFQANSCVNCHGGTNGLYLDTYAGVMAGGRHGAGVVPNNPGSSYIFEQISSPSMPGFSSASYHQVADSQKQALQDWINAGAPNN